MAQPIYGVLLVILYLCYSRKTKAMTFKPDVTTEEEEVKKPDVITEEEEVKEPDVPNEEEVQKASPYFTHVQHEQAKVEDNESIEMTPLSAANDSRGRVQLLALPCLHVVVCALCVCKQTEMPSDADVLVHVTLEHFIV